MSYKDALIRANTYLAADPKTRFIGYGLLKGRALGTLVNVPAAQIIEMPVAENLMMDMAIGMALVGCKPVVFLERMDFLMNCMDALVNHLDKISTISQGEFNPKVIIRCIVGNKNKPLYTGLTHIQDFTEGLQAMVTMPVVQLKTVADINYSYEKADKALYSTVLVEYKDLI